MIDHQRFCPVFSLFDVTYSFNGNDLTLRKENSALETLQHKICVRDFKPDLLSGRSRGLQCVFARFLLWL